MTSADDGRLIERDGGSTRRPANASQSGPQAIVVGGGFGGMAAALRLRAKGYRVTLVERLPDLGGRAQVFTKGGFRHDAGPTVLTAPILFEELFALFGRKLSDYVELKPLDVWYNFRFADGSQFNYGGTPEQLLEEIHRHEPADVDGYQRLLEHSHRLFDAAFTDLSSAPFHSPWSMIREAPRLVGLSAYQTVWQMVGRFLKNPNLRQAFSVQPLLVGGNPFTTTSIYGLIHYLERKWGVLYAVGGTGALVQALVRLMVETGIEIRTGETVQRIDVRGGNVAGVTLASGAHLPAAVVVSNCDPLHLYGAMLPDAKIALAAQVKQRARLSMGLFVLYFGTRRTYPSVERHTIMIGPRFRQHLDNIFHRLVLDDDLCLYVHRPTATDPSFAPKGADSFYALCPVPNRRSGHDWKAEAPRLRDRIVAHLDKTLLPGLHGAITDEFWMTPADFQDRYLSVDGAGFSIAPHFSQSAWFRFHNRGEGIGGLYLVGAGTHPGAGIPGVLCSAKVVDRLVPAVV